MRTFILIVIDQLGWADGARLKRIQALLGRPTPFLVPYFPTVTEAAHASLSTGGVPSEHEVIGGDCYRRCGGSMEFVPLDEHVFTARGLGRGTPIARRLAETGIQPLIVAGKEKVARLLDPRPNAAGPGLRLTFAKGANAPDAPLQLRVHDEQGERSITSLGLAALGTLDSLTSAETDCRLIDLGEHVLHRHRDPGRDAFLFLGLPLLDQLGHRLPRASAGLGAVIDTLDRKLDWFLRRAGVGASEDVHVVVTGDHGCHPVTTVVWPDVDGACANRADDQGVQGSLPLPLQDLETCTSGRTPRTRPCVLFDGATMRLWAKPGRVEAVRAFLQTQWRSVLSAAFASENVGLAAPYATASFSPAAWGDVIGFAHKHVSLCRLEWMRPQGSGWAVPVAEHGSGERDDREVPCWGDSAGLCGLTRAVLRALGRNQ